MDDKLEAFVKSTLSEWPSEDIVDLVVDLLGGNPGRLKEWKEAMKQDIKEGLWEE